MIRRSIPVFTIVLTLVAPVFLADAAEPFPGYKPDRRTIEIQQKVDYLFDEGEYERAMIIYRNELAPLGDKYAQYMIGYMYLAGKGVAKDLPAAAAWYRLAAERRQASFVRESRKLAGLLTPEQQEQADNIFADIRARFGDAVLMIRLIEEDLANLQGRASDTSSSFRDLPLSDRAQPISRERRESQLVSRIQYVRSMLAVDGWAGAESRRRFQELERRAELLLREAR